MRCKFVYVLLFLGTFLYSVSCSGQETTVYDIARKGTLTELKELLSRSPQAALKVNEYGYSALTLACYNGNEEVAEYLITNTKNLDSSSDRGTALMAATMKNNIKLVALLLKHKADPNLADVQGATALHLAVIFNQTEVAKLLFSAGARIDIKDNRGKTAHDYATINQNNTLLHLFKNK